MKLNKFNHLTPALSPNPIGGEGVGHRPPPDARMDLFVTADTTRPAHMEMTHALSVGRTGGHPKLGIRFARQGCEPTSPVVFYQQ